MEGSALLQCMSKSPTGQRWNALVSVRSSHTEQVAQGGCGCPIPGGTQGQAGCGSGQPGLVVGDPAHSRGLKLDDHCGPFQPRPSYDSSKMLSVHTNYLRWHFPARKLEQEWKRSKLHEA